MIDFALCSFGVYVSDAVLCEKINNELTSILIANNCGLVVLFQDSCILSDNFGGVQRRFPFLQQIDTHPVAFDTRTRKNPRVATSTRYVNEKLLMPFG